MVYKNNAIVAIKEENATATEVYPVLYTINNNSETAIENIATEAGNAEIYDITGRRVENITKAGIYIVGGKKVLVK